MPAARGSAMGSTDAEAGFQREFTRKLEMALLGAFSIISLLLGYMVGSVAARTFLGSSIVVSLLLYLILLAFYPRYRFPFLAYMVGADAGSLMFDATVLHAKVVVYPLVVLLINDLGRFSIDVDFVQLLILIEAIVYIVRKLHEPRKRLSEGS